MLKSGSSEVSLEAFSKVVEAVYDCALDPNRWHDTIRLIADLFESQRCTLGVHDHVNGCNELTFQVGCDDEHYYRLHEEKYGQMSPLFTPLMMLTVGAVATQAMLVDERRVLGEPDTIEEWVKPQGLRDMMAAAKRCRQGNASVG